MRLLDIVVCIILWGASVAYGGKLWGATGGRERSSAMGGPQAPIIYGERQAAPQVERVVIPFEFVNGLIWVRVAVPDAKKPLDFVVDSGAGATVLDFDAARRLKLKFGEACPVFGVGQNGVAYKIAAFQGSVAGVALSPEVFALSLRHSKREQKRRIDGMIGQDFFRHRVVEIDFARQVMVLLPKSVKRKGATELPLRYQADVMCVPVALEGGRPEWMRLDTGCVTPLEWTLKPTAQVRFPEAKGKKNPSRMEGMTSVQLGGAKVGPLPVGFHAAPFFKDEAGLLGNGVLSLFRVTIDAREMRLLLE